MSTPIMPVERKAADDVRELIQSVSGLLGVVYVEVGRFRDGDRSAAERASDAFDAAMSSLESVRDLMRRLTS